MIASTMVLSEVIPEEELGKMLVDDTVVEKIVEVRYSYNSCYLENSMMICINQKLKNMR